MRPKTPPQNLYENIKDYYDISNFSNNTLLSSWQGRPFFETPYQCLIPSHDHLILSSTLIHSLNPKSQLGSSIIPTDHPIPAGFRPIIKYRKNRGSILPRYKSIGCLHPPLTSLYIIFLFGLTSKWCDMWQLMGRCQRIISGTFHLKNSYMYRVYQQNWYIH